MLAVAASLLIAAGIVSWVLLQKHNEGMVAQTAVLDLRNRSVSRGAEQNPGELPLEVSRASTHWEIYLPLGSSEGQYDVRITRPSGELVVATNGTAKLRDHVTLLQVGMSLSSTRLGRYVLQIRRKGLEWNSYAIVLEQNH